MTESHTCLLWMAAWLTPNFSKVGCDIETLGLILSLVVSRIEHLSVTRGHICYIDAKLWLDACWWCLLIIDTTHQCVSLLLCDLIWPGLTWPNDLGQMSPSTLRENLGHFLGSVVAEATKSQKMSNVGISELMPHICI